MDCLAPISIDTRLNADDFLWPETKPYKRFDIALEHGYRLNGMCYGNPQGIPVVYLHGGPGSGISSRSPRYFNPDIYNIIIYNQRGAGDADYDNLLSHNTTAHLVADLEKLRSYLELDAWLVSGGSWGSALALLYAQAYPQHVKGLLLCAVFLANTVSCEWVYSASGAARIYPDNYAEVSAIVQQYPRLLEAVSTGDEARDIANAQSLLNYFGNIMHFVKQPSLNIKESGEAKAILNRLRILLHYEDNHFFMEDETILNNIGRIQHIPAIALHGRYDMCCPLGETYRLKKAWPALRLTVVPDAGHRTIDPALAKALVDATDDFAKILA